MGDVVQTVYSIMGERLGAEGCLKATIVIPDSLRVLTFVNTQ